MRDNIQDNRYVYLIDNRYNIAKWWSQVKINDLWINNPDWNGQFDCLNGEELKQLVIDCKKLNIKIYDIEYDFYI